MVKHFKILLLSLLFAFNANKSDAQFIINPYVYVSCDADAQSFITATGITDATQKEAICQLVLDLKAYSLWTKIIAIYPMVGGTATTHKYNLKDPQDTDGAFRLTFSGGWTHDSAGATPNGTTGYANTHFVPFTHQSTGNTHVSAYSSSNLANTGAVLGSRDVAPYRTGYYMIEKSAGNFNISMNNGSAGNITSANSNNTDGLYIVTRTSDTNLKVRRMNSEIASTAVIDGNDNSPYAVYLGAINDYDTNIVAYGSQNISFITIGEGLSTTECDNLYDAIQTFQTTLSRQI